MTIATLLERGTRKLDARVNPHVETIRAVSDDQLWEILEANGLLSELDSGALVCYVTGVPLTRENVGGIVIASDGPHLVADNYTALTGSSREKRG